MKGVQDAERIANALNSQYPAHEYPITPREARELGLNCEAGTCELLVETAGTDLMTLVNELEKLQVYAHPEVKLTRSHVQDAVGQGLVDNVFELTSLLGMRDFAGVNSLFRRMMEQGEAPIMITALVIGHFRKLLLVESSFDKGSSLTPKQILGNGAYFFPQYQAQARKFPPGKLTRTYTRLMRLSEDLRSSRVDKEILFQDFLLDACLDG
jgi:DNA polymerase-3 subunit delta